jgi:U4/U6 small nuclear ribonucleoprotein PRP3
MMTVKEMAKARQLRHAPEEQKDKCGRILLSLMPPDPPKIKMSNLISMRVLTSEVVRDPTLVEQRVQKEVDLQKTKHEDDNKG